MGDRANVFIQEDEDGTGVYLYTHWSGTELPGMVQEALAGGRGRWDDPAYLARIVFCRMVRGHETGETGFGISVHIPDGNTRVLVLDTTKQQVRYEAHEYAVGDQPQVRRPLNERQPPQTFEAFSAAAAVDWPDQC